MYFFLLLSHIDQSVASWFHEQITGTSSGVLLLMSDPGSPECVGSLTAATGFLLLWKRLWRHLLALGLAVPGGMLVNEILKITIRRERPFHASPYLDLGGYSFPSAHTMAATLIYGLLAVFVISAVKRRRLQFLVSLTACWLVVTVAFSRIALGAHFLSDVVAGMATAIAWLYFSLNVVRRLVPKPAVSAVAADDPENR